MTDTSFVTTSNYSRLTIKELPNTPESLPFSKVFHLEYDDPDRGVLQTGTITARRATIGMLSEIGVMTARFNGGLPVDSTTDFVNTMRAYCSVILTDIPKWLDFTNGYDVELLRAIYDHVFAWEGSFRRKAMGPRRE